MDIIVKSPYADIDIPEVTVTEFILKKCMEYGENTALVNLTKSFFVVKSNLKDRNFLSFKSSTMFCVHRTNRITSNQS